MSASVPSEGAGVRTRLQAELEKLRDQLRTMEESAQKARKAEGNRPGFGKRVGDFTSEATDALNHQAVSRIMRATMEQIARALQKLEEGSYGLCDGCRQPIPAERLEALPSATLCVGCKSKQERRRW